MDENPYQSPLETSEQRIHESEKTWKELWEIGILIAGIFGVGLAGGLTAPLLDKKEMPDWFVVPFFPLPAVEHSSGLCLRLLAGGPDDKQNDTHCPQLKSRQLR